MIQIKNVSKSFGDTKVLEKTNSVIPRGSIYALIGTNGAGKSTLLNLIDGIYRCDSGCVEINGENRPIEKFYEVFGNSDVLLRASCGVNLGGLGVALDYKLPWSTLQKYFQDKEDTIETVKKGRVSLALLFNLF